MLTILASLLTTFQLCLISIEYKSFSVYCFMISYFVKNITGMQIQTTESEMGMFLYASKMGWVSK